MVEQVLEPSIVNKGFINLIDFNWSLTIYIENEPFLLFGNPFS